MWQFILNPDVLIYLVNVASASLLLCGTTLVIAKWQWSRPFKHALLASAVVLTLVSPVVVMVAGSFGFGMVPLAIQREPERLQRGLSSSTVKPTTRLSNRIEDQAVHRTSWVSQSESTPTEMFPDATIAEEERRFAQNIWCVCMFVWCLGTVIGLVRLAIGLMIVGRLKLSLRPVADARIEQVAQRACQSVGVRRSVRIAESTLAPAPMSFGIWSPVIVIPASLSKTISDRHLLCILTHEAAHVLRWDGMIALIQRCAAIGFWWNPLCHASNRQISRIREEICDDYVASIHGSGVALAEAIVFVAEWCTGPRVSLPGAATLLDESDQLAARITRLTEKERNMSLRLSVKSMSLCCAVVGVLSISLMIPVTRAANPNKKQDPNSTAVSDGPNQTVRESLNQSKIDKSTLPIVSENFRHSTTIQGRLVGGGGIIERIEGTTIRFRSGDYVIANGETIVLVPQTLRHPPRRLKTSDLEAGMAVGYSMLDGRVQKIVLSGIVANPIPTSKARERVRQLKLVLGNEVSTSLDGRFPMRIMSKTGEAKIRIGQTRLIELPKASETVTWQCGTFKPETIEDIEPFDFIMVDWKSNGRITWTCYRSTTKNPPQASTPSTSPDDNQIIIKDIEKFRTRASLSKLQALINLESIGRLEAAMSGFEKFHRDHRSEAVGLSARFHQGRCTYKLGQLDEAVSIFAELLALPDGEQRLDELKGKVRAYLKANPDLSRATNPAGK